MTSSRDRNNGTAHLPERPSRGRGICLSCQSGVKNWYQSTSSDRPGRNRIQANPQWSSTQPVSLFVLAPPPRHAPGRTVAEDQRKEGFSEGTVGAVKTSFLRAERQDLTRGQCADLASAL